MSQNARPRRQRRMRTGKRIKRRETRGFPALGLLAILFVPGLGVATSHAQEVERRPGEVWTETIRDKSWCIGWPTEEAALKYCERPTMRKAAKERQAEVVKVEWDPEVLDREWTTDWNRTERWTVRWHARVTFRKLPTVDAEAQLKADLLREAANGLKGNLLSALNEALKSSGRWPRTAGAALGATSILNHASNLQDAIRRVDNVVHTIESTVNDPLQGLQEQLGELTEELKSIESSVERSRSSMPAIAKAALEARTMEHPWKKTPKEEAASGDEDSKSAEEEGDPEGDAVARSEAARRLAAYFKKLDAIANRDGIGFNEADTDSGPPDEAERERALEQDATGGLADGTARRELRKPEQDRPRRQEANSSRDEAQGGVDLERGARTALAEVTAAQRKQGEVDQRRRRERQTSSPYRPDFRGKGECRTSSFSQGLQILQSLASQDAVWNKYPMGGPSEWRVESPGPCRLRFYRGKEGQPVYEEIHLDLRKAKSMSFDQFCELSLLFYEPQTKRTIKPRSDRMRLDNRVEPEKPREYHESTLRGFEISGSTKGDRDDRRRILTELARSLELMLCECGPTVNETGIYRSVGQFCEDYPPALQP